jgi:hypothetical protein
MANVETSETWPTEQVYLIMDAFHERKCATLLAIPR